MATKTSGKMEATPVITAAALLLPELHQFERHKLLLSAEFIVSTTFSILALLCAGIVLYIEMRKGKARRQDRDLDFRLVRDSEGNITEVHMRLEPSNKFVGHTPKTNKSPLEATQQESSRVFKKAKNLMFRYFRPNTPSGCVRIEWICKCGDLLYADFNTSSQETIDYFDDVLTKRGVSSHPQSSISNRRQEDISLQQLPGLRGAAAATFSNTGSSAALSFDDPGTPQVGKANRSRSWGLPQVSIFFELCVNTGNLVKSLGEVDVTAIKTDGEFFAAVKQHYLRLRSFRARFWLLKPSVISYVKFSVEDRCRVGILQGPVALPPKKEVDEKRYVYAPCAPENEPPSELPISSALFLHYSFECPASSKNYLWLPRLPRKLEESILSSPGPAAFGWGIHIDEKVNRFKIFTLNLAFLVISGLAALLWNALKHDFQGAFGFATWIFMVLNTLVAVFVAKWSQE